ncbi:MAG: hypothetical protein DWQ10_02765 [Calditrichaeota bacterium]|nr:MAG: hypothetical protein DWQ10_02765 [Calditrichota bacterium]
MLEIKQNPNWPIEATEFIANKNFQGALGLGLQTMQTRPGDVQAYELAAYVLYRVWLFRSASEFIRRGMALGSGKSDYLHDYKMKLESNSIPLHEGLPVLTSDAICSFWLSEASDGTYSSEQTLVFEENLNHLLAYFDGHIGYEQMPADMQLIIKKACFLDQMWDFSQSRVVVDLGGFDGILAWTLYKLHPNIDKIFLIDTVFPQAAPEFYIQHDIPIECVQADLREVDYNNLPQADTFLLVDVAEHVPEKAFETILSSCMLANAQSRFYIYTPSLNHNNLERYRPEISSLPLYNFDFWVWTGSALSPANIAHVPSHVSYKSTGWLQQVFNAQAFHCHSIVEMQNGNVMPGRLYFSTHKAMKENIWQAQGLLEGVLEFQI